MANGLDRVWYGKAIDPIASDDLWRYGMAVVTTGVARIIDLIAADGVYLAVGSGTTTPLISDTELVTEVTRVAVTATVKQGNQLQLRGLFTNADLPSTVEEIGLFLDASATVDSGELLVRALESLDKGTADLLLVFEITEAY